MQHPSPNLLFPYIQTSKCYSNNILDSIAHPFVPPDGPFAFYTNSSQPLKPSPSFSCWILFFGCRFFSPCYIIRNLLEHRTKPIGQKIDILPYTCANIFELNWSWSCSFQMGSQSSDHQTMVGSSISLLQERFRQLERVRERREEQDLLKLFSKSQPKITFPTGDTLSLGTNSMGRPFDFMRDIKTGTLANFRVAYMIIRSNSPDVEESDVDTSLHL